MKKKEQKSQVLKGVLDLLSMKLIMKYPKRAAAISVATAVVALLANFFITK